MKKGLLIRAMARYFFAVILVGMLIFLPAGTLTFQRGWLLMSVLFVPMGLVGILLFFTNKNLLENRMLLKEKQRGQSLLIFVSGLVIVLGFVIGGLDYRFGRRMFPESVSMIGAILFLVMYLLYGEVLRENPYLFRTVKTEQDQKVIDRGLYGIVRHPMYTITLIMFLLIPFILGSFSSLILFFSFPFIFIIRIKEEEQLLERELEGYKKYKQKVTYRMIPFLW